MLGTANIAALAFLPALREVGDRAVVVGSRDSGRAEGWARDNGVERVADYAGAVSAKDVDAVYIALPNHLHVRWAAQAAAAGKVVLCEKPLGLDASQVDGLLSGLPGDALVWEAFVFPFHPQTDLCLELCAQGEVGELREVVSEFHFTVSRERDIRWEADGGALLDVGCYPLRLARLLFAADPDAAAARAFSANGVDAEVAAVVDFPASRRLLLSAGMRGATSTFSRLVGRRGELRISNPFHPTASDTVQLWVDQTCRQTWPAVPGSAFTHALRHIGTVVRGEAPPRHLAATDAPGNARALDLVRAAAAGQGVQR